MPFPKILESHLDKPVAIFGAGVSGNAVKNCLTPRGISVVIYDKSGVGGSLAEFDDACAGKHALCIFSPSFPQEHPWLQAARRNGLLCLAELDFAAIFLQGKLPPLKRANFSSQEEFQKVLASRFNLTAITGTNGKTTLTEFLSFAHRLAGRAAFAVGNNGTPMTSLLDTDSSSAIFPICEVSSFQAEALYYFSPRTVLWTNFDDDHIERHGSRKAYFKAKLRLIELQESLRLIVGDFPEKRETLPLVREARSCIVGESVAEAAKELGITLPERIKIARREDVKDCVPAGTLFETYPQMENYAIARLYWIEQGFPLKELEDAAKAFRPCPHRLAKVAELEKKELTIEFWNDSKGTNFHAVYAALETFPNSSVFWIGGGRSKGGDIVEFSSRLSQKIQQAFVIGETAEELAKELPKQNIPTQIASNLQNALLLAFKAAQTCSGKKAVILFSPGFASFDMFKSYSDRGNQFVELVETLVERFSEKNS